MFSRFILLCYLLLSSVSSLFAAECLDVFPSGWRQNTPANEQLINFPVNTSAATLADGTTLPRGDNYYLFSGLDNKDKIFVGAATASETTARLFFRASVNWKNVKINEYGNPEDLIIVVDSSLQITGGDTVINAIIYVKGTITVNGNATINGAAAAVTNADSFTVNYDTSYITNADFNGMCGNSNNHPVPLANYRFDECEYTGTGFEVIDQTGNYSATSHGGVNTFSAGKVERGAELIDENHHFETSIPLSQDFSISTWFKKPTSNSNNQIFVLGAMQSGGDLLYLDRNENWRWGVYNNGTGSINGTYSFALLDSNWHHMTLVYSGGQTKLYIDGTLEDVVNKVPVGTLKYIGTSFDGVNSSNPQAFRAPLDEFIVFNSALTSAEISDIYAYQNAENNYDGNSRDPVSCSIPSTEYRFDETEYTGATNEIIDTIGGFHGQAIVSQPIESGKVCNAIDLSASGTGNYAILDETILTTKTDFSISLWAKTSKTSNQSILSGAGASNNELIMWFTGDTNFSPHLKNTYNGNITTLSIADDNWHHLVWTREGSQSCLFVDKALQGCVTQTTLPLNIQSLILGQEQDSIGGDFSSSQAFDGLLDELLIFDSAISLAQITTVYDNQDVGLGFDGSARSCPTPTPPVLDIRFDEVDWTAANSVLDSSGNNYHANAVDVTPTAGFICHAADLSASGIDDYITLDNQALDGRESFSISLWYKTSKTGAQSLISGANISSFNELIYWFDNNTTFSPHVKGGSQDITTSNVSDNAWHHIVWTRSGSEILFYHDGVLQSGSASLSTGALHITNLILGQEQDSLGGSFASSQAVEGLIDELIVFKRSINATEVGSIFTNQTNGLNYDGTTRADCLPLFHHFEIDVIDGQGLTCAADNITIKACADATCSTLNTDTTDVLLSINGTPHKTVTVVGSTNTTINYTTADVATLSLDQTYECVNGVPNTCDVTFANAGFIFSQTSAVNDAIDNQEAGTPFTGYLRAVESVDGVCTGLFNGDVTVKLSQKNVLPSGTEGLTFTVKDTHSNTQTLTKHGTYIDVELAFNSASEAILTNATYLDAGQIQLYASYNSAGVNLVGSSNTFWVSPKNFVVIAKSGLNNLTESTSSGAITHKAGVDFSIEITAYNALPSPTITQNYQPNYNDRFEFSATRTGPISGSDGILNINGQSVTLGSDLTGFSHILLSPNSFVNGKATVSANYSEVGLLQVQARDKDYGSDHIEIYSLSSNIGRFIPDHFDVNITSNSFKNTCAIGATSTTDFTYIGQPFLYFNPPELLITAKNFSGVTTQNYTQTGYQKLIAADIERIFPVADSTINGEDSLTKMVVSSSISEGDLTTPTPMPSSNAGEMIYTFNLSDSFTYTKGANSLVGAFTAVYDIVIDVIEDSEGVNASTSLTDNVPLSNTVTPMGVNLRFGRWAIENTFGPETSSLPLPMAIQYWNGNGFVTNTFDICTAFDTTNLTIDNSNISPATTIASGSGNFADGLTQDIILSAPGAGKQGAVPVSYVIPAMPWLLYDWDWNGVDTKEYNKNPTATATFGRFRGNDRIIYQREVH